MHLELLLINLKISMLTETNICSVQNFLRGNTASHHIIDPSPRLCVRFSRIIVHCQERARCWSANWLIKCSAILLIMLHATQCIVCGSTAMNAIRLSTCRCSLAGCEHQPGGCANMVEVGLQALYHRLNPAQAAVFLFSFLLQWQVTADEGLRANIEELRLPGCELRGAAARQTGVHHHQRPRSPPLRFGRRCAGAEVTWHRTANQRRRSVSRHGRSRRHSLQKAPEVCSSRGVSSVVALVLSF